MDEDTPRDGLEREYLELVGKLGWMPGHFYSPYPNVEELQHRYGALSDPSKTALPGLDLRTAEQLAYLEALISVERPSLDALGFDADNDFYRAGDALVLVAQICMLRPKRIVEIGSGHSTALIQKLITHCGLDTKHIVIDPYPENIFTLIGETVQDDLTLWETPVQAVDPELAEQLEPSDILFIDSSHVCKPGSDVNALVFEWLPRLPIGVHVHFHDIQFPFESRWDWITEGRMWAESYLIRAFLSFNPAFEVTFFTHQITLQYPDRIAALGDEFEALGSSLWLKRVK